MRLLGSTFKEDLNLFLKNNALWICIAIVVIIAITIILVFVVKNHSKGDKKVSSKGNEWIDALGGVENITDISAMGSRLTVTLKDNNLMNKEQLNALGVTNIMTMSNKVTLIIEDKAEKIASVISKAINN